jgi:hypothetical protein
MSLIFLITNCETELRWLILTLSTSVAYSVLALKFAGTSVGGTYRTSCVDDLAFLFRVCADDVK